MKLTAPTTPGVYLFKKGDEVIYVGKAKNLSRRIGSYFRRKNSDWKVSALLEEHTTIQFVTTKTEAEALVLEAKLVKDFAPKYNVLLKSGQPFVYLKITNEPLPTLELVRTKTADGTYFGPFMNKTNARRVWNYLITLFKLKRCTVKNNHGCLDYHIGRCAGTCVGSFNDNDYKTRIDLIKKLFMGSLPEAIAQIDKEIKSYSAQKEFEKARHLYQYKTDLEAISTYISSKLTDERYETVAAKTVSYSLTEAEYERAAASLQKELKLEKKPKSIDCFDISHFQSRYLVGACVRFTNGNPDKNAFRRFKIKSFSTQNDYAALQEIVQRRYKQDAYPDVILIDGGKGQLSAVKAVLDSGAVCISLAKREERIFSEYHADGLVLDVKTPIGKLCIALRDYTHHFAIQYHRLLRTKEMKTIQKKV